MICPNYPSPELFLFTNDIPSLIYYSHIPAVLISLALGIYVYFHNKKSFGSKVLLALSVAFSLWVFIDLVLWTNNNSEVIMFYWSLLGIVYGAINILVFFLVYFFAYQKDIPFKWWLTSLLFLLPLMLLTPTKFNLGGFNLDLCGGAGFESPYFVYYKLFFGILTFAAVIFVAFKQLRQLSKEKKPTGAVWGMSVGAGFYLASFLIAEFLTSYLVDKGVLSDYSLTQYSLFGMIAFMGLFAYILVKYRVFNIRLIGANVIVMALWIATASILFIFDIEYVRAVVAGTLILITIMGYSLVNSVRKEEAQREKIEGLAAELAQKADELYVANESLKELDVKKTEFVSIASHQLRAPVTAIKGYSSMILEGSFGIFPEQAKEAVSRIFESSQRLVVVIEDFLNVTRIELGKMKYEITDFDLNKAAKAIVDELKQSAIRRNLKLSYKASKGDYTIHADFGKVSQAVQNLVDNAIKYTEPGGKIEVSVSKIDNKTRFAVKDNGIGISPEGMDKLFAKFSRAEDGTTVNAVGTGLGLYVAKQIIEAQNGRIWAESEGLGKGSTFFLEF